MSPLSYREPLSSKNMREVMTEIMTGGLPAGEIKVFLSTLAERGETAEEIATAACVLREHAVKIPLKKNLELCDTCGTGGDGQGTINVSTLAALVAASAGVKVAKHGNRAASSRCGSADVLEALGINLSASAEQVARSIEEVGFGFCFAPMFHPAMKIVAPVRKALGVRTIFNLIGPLANPAALTFQLVGVSDERLLQPMAEALIRFGVRHAMVVHGRDGLDEISTTAPTDTLEVRESRITRATLDTRSFDIPRVSLPAIQGGTVETNVALSRNILDGKEGPIRDIVLVNAGCVIFIANHAGTIQEGMEKARHAIDTGKARQLLDHVRSICKDKS